MFFIEQECAALDAVYLQKREALAKLQLQLTNMERKPSTSATTKKVVEKFDHVLKDSKVSILTMREAPENMIFADGQLLWEMSAVTDPYHQMYSE